MLCALLNDANVSQETCSDSVVGSVPIMAHQYFCNVVLCPVMGSQKSDYACIMQPDIRLLQPVFQDRVWHRDVCTGV